VDPHPVYLAGLVEREQQVKSTWNQLGQILANSDVVADFQVGWG
jgi:hypothetical protein